jgi:mRNA (guanine-N7-)-methyltransferase
VFRAEFHVLDAFHKDWATVIGQNSFHAISCQFAYHYSFETEASARHAIKMVAKYLRPGGYFFGTIPDFGEIRRRLLESEDGRRIGNDIFTLTLDEGTELEPGFGQRYHFDLEEAIEGCPEYFIPFPVLEALAEEVGLEPILCSPFPRFFETSSKKREHHESVDRMRIVDRRTGAMAASGEELEAASLYLAFCFRKKK